MKCRGKLDFVLSPKNGTFIHKMHFFFGMLYMLANHQNEFLCVLQYLHLLKPNIRKHGKSIPITYSLFEILIVSNKYLIVGWR